MDHCIGTERFDPEPDNDRINELEMLRKFLTESVAAIDK
jgi:hypothetical protein